WKDSWPTTIPIHAVLEMTKTLGSTPGNSSGIDNAGNFAFVNAADPLRPYLKVTASACDKYGFGIVAMSDNDCSCNPSCGDCQGGPIRVSNGNMRYTDADPLPAVGFPLSRTYDSRNGDNGWFGHGWTSYLDESLRTEPEPDRPTT